MAGSSFTRDEVILALDVLYSSGNSKLTADSDEIKDLSYLLNRLPIYPNDNRRPDFRNTTGIARQLSLFRSSCKSGKKSPNIGQIFFDVAFEFEDRLDELHSIAEAIRRNELAYTSCFGASYEDISFTEGILLGHLHRLIEQRDGIKVPLKDHCEICNSVPTLCYCNVANLLQNHLIVEPVKMNFLNKYHTDSFLTVCPTCHAALHSYRPWIGKENCKDILF